MDTVWLSLNLIPLAVSIALVNFGARDYRAFIVDFLIDLILENKFISICRMEIRRLISYKLQAVDNYLHRIEILFNQYRMQENVVSLQSL